MALIVEAGGEQWLTDRASVLRCPSNRCGGTRRPRKIPSTVDIGSWSQHTAGASRSMRAAERGKALYEIMDEVPQAEDFEIGNWFTSTHPASSFARDLIVTRVEAAGRMILYGTELTIRLPGGMTRRENLSARHVESVLQKVFGLSVDLELRTVLEKIASRN